ncbi:GEM-like protein 4 [Vitis vinifera]|uniref:GEM-like protein 4 n=1 Tax=Vitis vinifera TaxID=29760 RepID=A0A438K585_VITVI|nr:GEM-like protein 4 [Vitis vinifera]
MESESMEHGGNAKKILKITRSITKLGLHFAKCSENRFRCFCAEKSHLERGEANLNHLDGLRRLHPSLTHHHEDERCQKGFSFQISTWTLGRYFDLLANSVLFKWLLPSPQWPIFFCKRSGYIHGHGEIHQVMNSPLPQVEKALWSTSCSLRYEEPACTTDQCYGSRELHGTPFANGVVFKIAGEVELGGQNSSTRGSEESFQANFGVGEGEKLLKASQCYLSTTAGPTAGLLFISTQRVAFCSERPIKFSSNGELVRFHYKVSILLRKVKRVDPSENVKNPSQKYMKIVTVDNFDFWFMGFLNYQKSFNCLQQALSQS